MHHFYFRNLEKCPVCREESVNGLQCRQLTLEALVAERLENEILECRNKAEGCSFKALLPELETHEAGCYARTVLCPGRHRGACEWTGPVNQMVKHVLNKRCVSFVKSDKPAANGVYVFSSYIGDFAGNDETVFKKNNNSHWKPVFFIHKDLGCLLLYLLIFRDRLGKWWFTLRSFSSEAVRNSYSVKLGLSRRSEDADAEPDINGVNDVFGYGGKVHSSELDDNTIYKSGHFLSLDDGQIKILMTGEKNILKYTVRIAKKNQQ